MDNTIYAKLADLLEVETVNSSDVLEEFECWDSLAILSIIAWASESYGVALSSKEIVAAKTIGGLEALLCQK